MLRYRLARLALCAHRAAHAFGSPGAGFRILLFHDIAARHFARFEALVAHVVRDQGAISPAEATAWLDGAVPERFRSGTGKAPCLFSFDDGFASNHDVAMRVLAPHGVKALFFVSAGMTDLAPGPQREAVAANVFGGRIAVSALAPDLRLMRWDELAELRAAGHEIGCHGLGHRRLTKLAGDELAREVIEAGRLIETRLDAPTDWFAYAFGDIASIDPAALGTIASAFKYCRSGLRGANRTATPKLALAADSIPLNAPPTYQSLLIEGGLDLLYRARRRRLAAMAAAGTSHPQAH